MDNRTVSFTVKDRTYTFTGVHADAMRHYQPFVEPAPAPPWLYELARHLGARGNDAARAHARGNGSAEGETIEEGRRDATLTSMAGHMRRAGFSETSIRVALLEENESRCEPPLPDSQVVKIARSIARYQPEPLANENLHTSKPANGKTNGRSYADELKPPPQEAKGPILYPLPRILEMEIPEPAWAVPGVMAEGLTILAGKPKLGKSMLALNLAISIAAGGKAMGETQTTAGAVLYLSLEDRLRRVQFRSRKMLVKLGVAASAALEVAVEWPKQGDGGLTLVRQWLERTPHPRAVIVDVWQKFRPSLRQGGSQYEQDYDHASAMKSLGDSFGCSILALHHCKKAKADDVVDEVSGTLGLCGAADGIIVLTRARNEYEAELFVSGRDTEEKRLAIAFDKESFVWTLLGDAEERTENQTKAKVIDFLKHNAGAIFTIGDIAAGLKLDEARRDALRMLLLRMHYDQQINRVGPGRYRWPVEET